MSTPSFEKAISEAKSAGLTLSSTYGHLEAVTRDETLPADLVEDLTEWRRRNLRPFMRMFEPTIEGTLRWAREIQESDRRILMMIHADGARIGHVGFADFGRGGFEICDVLRGEDAKPGRMHDALKSLIDWATKNGLLSVFLHVASDEIPALSLYHRLGFVPVAMRPLKKIADGGETTWVDAEHGDLWDRFSIRLTLVGNAN